MFVLVTRILPRSTPVKGLKDYDVHVVKSPNNKKARVKMGDLCSRAQPIRRQ